MSALCLSAGALAAAIPASGFMLAWTHSIEQTRWEEYWRLAGDHLVLDEARVHGSGAGMEPAAGARLQDGVWRYRPDLPPQRRLVLRHSPHAAGYELCIAGRCQPLANHLPGLGRDAVIELAPCRQTTAPPPR